MPSSPDPTFWSARRVLVTGHTGFKGTWLTTWLGDLGAEVHGLSLPAGPAEQPLWGQVGLSGIAETRTDVGVPGWHDAVLDFDPEVVLHLAAQPLVSEGYRNPAETFRSNVQGTVEVMSLLDRLPGLQAAVIITTDKVYDVRQPTPHREDAFFGGKDPYSASKAAAELVVHSWPTADLPVATARAGNVIGGGDQGRDRILPDLLRAWSADGSLHLRRPTAVRPWQHVVEPLAGYLLYAEHLAAGREVPRGLNFGPDRTQAVPVIDLVEHAATEWRRLRPDSTPTWDVAAEPPMVETEDLTLEPGLAAASLGWRGVWPWREAVSRTIEWHLRVEAGEPAGDVVREHLADYLRALG
jgi:CDP-glucose 4,6-dehydratase